MRSHALAAVAFASALALPAAAQQGSALPDVPGKLGPALEAVHSCTSQAERGNMADSSKRAFVIECVNGNVGAGPVRRTVPPQQAAGDCEAAAAYLRLAGGEREPFLASCRAQFSAPAG